MSVLAADSKTGAAAPFELAATAWGCAGALRALDAATPTSSAQHAGVTYAHPGLEEWYAIGPAGLEQGLTIRELPECATVASKLQIRLRFFRMSKGRSRA